MDTLLSSHEAQNGKDDETSKETGPAVDERQDKGVPAGEEKQNMTPALRGHLTIGQVTLTSVYINRKSYL